MNFSAEIKGIPSWKYIIEGDGKGRKKTATCRLWKDGDYFNEDAEYSINPIYPNGNLTLYSASGKTKRRVGNTYAVQKKRTWPGLWYKPRFGLYKYRMKYGAKSEEYLLQNGYRPARIRILDMSKIDVREMTEEQAYKEGFDSVADYLAWWVGHYDKQINLDTVEIYREGSNYPYKFTPRPEMVASLLKYRPADIYTGCFYGFELVEE